jgi:formylmethanofuran dehydrogenase subunit C
MHAGRLQIAYSCGTHTGEGMRGGILRVQGRIAALGRAKHGTVYEGGHQVFPEGEKEGAEPRNSPQAGKRAR